MTAARTRRVIAVPAGICSRHKSTFPRLRRKGKAFYFDTQEKPRRWIPLGSDPSEAIAKYRKLLGGKGPEGTVPRILSDYLTHLEAGGRASFGKPIATSTLTLYRDWAREALGHIPHRCHGSHARRRCELPARLRADERARRDLVHVVCVSVRDGARPAGVQSVHRREGCTSADAANARHHGRRTRCDSERCFAVAQGRY